MKSFISFSFALVLLFLTSCTQETLFEVPHVASSTVLQAEPTPVQSFNGGTITIELQLVGIVPSGNTGELTLVFAGGEDYTDAVPVATQTLNLANATADLAVQTYSGSGQNLQITFAFDIHTFPLSSLQLGSTQSIIIHDDVIN